ncbi:RPII140-upstream gene protein [Culicoides brevitarsis]|uniref:RPII140-upstream gene protein n=1 Tax=Culicoides brevitarsis TaxID=469753 RepID=UPI00307C580F
MLRTASKTIPVSMAFLGFDFNIDDKDLIIPDKTELAKFQELRAQQSPMERLRAIYSISEFGELSPELNSIRQACLFGGFVGIMYGGFVDSRISYMNFMERNQATAFDNHFEAKKMLQNNVTTGFVRGAMKWGWRVALFTTSYTAISTTIASYRGKSSVWEYLAAGGLTGAIYKVNMGLKGMTAGGAAGLAMGGIAGLLTLGLLKLSGHTVEDVQYWQHRMQLSRLKITREAAAVDMNYQPTPLEMNHTLRVGEDKLSLDVLDELDKQLQKAEEKSTKSDTK